MTPLKYQQHHIFKFRQRVAILIFTFCIGVLIGSLWNSKAHSTFNPQPMFDYQTKGTR